MKKFFLTIGVLSSVFFLTACTSPKDSVVDLEKNFNEFQKSVQSFVDQSAYEASTYTPREPDFDSVLEPDEIPGLIPDPKIPQVEELQRVVAELKSTIDALKIEEEQKPEGIEREADPIFSKCAPLADFKSASWYEKLAKENKKHLTPTGRELNIKDGCLSDDENLFIFIQDLEGCGKIFKYDIAKNDLPAYVQAEHCIDEFTIADSKSIEFIGGVRDNNCITKFTGKYVFMEHRVQDVDQLKRCFETYTHQNFPFSVLVSDRYSIGAAEGGFSLLDYQSPQVAFTIREGELPAGAVLSEKTRSIHNVPFQHYTLNNGYGYMVKVGDRSFVFDNKDAQKSKEFEAIIDTIEFINL